MAGAGIVIDTSIDDARLQAALTRILAAGVRGSAESISALRQIGSYMVAATIRRFETETGPDGPWTPSARAREEGGQTLTDSGRLRSSIAYNVTGDGMEVGTNVVYAAIHQFGGRTRPRVIRPRHKRALFWPGARHPVAKVEHPGSEIPARPFLGFDERDRIAVGRIVLGMLERAAG
ncbi:MAG: phage virion morphogenesis protein [Defluviicoccus sp.]|nr:phage virion morphogenesis protein [Defluviicoccus sp.]